MKAVTPFMSTMFQRQSESFSELALQQSWQLWNEAAELRIVDRSTDPEELPGWPLSIEKEQKPAFNRKVLINLYNCPIRLLTVGYGQEMEQPLQEDCRRVPPLLTPNSNSEAGF